MTTSRKRTGAAGAPKISMFNTSGSLGGVGGRFAFFGSRAGGGYGAAVPVDIDSDRSDDERMPPPGAFGGPSELAGAVGVAPTTAAASGLLPPVGQKNNLGLPANRSKCFLRRTSRL